MKNLFLPFVVVALFAIGSCGDSGTNPLVDKSQQPFYYYFGEKIYLKERNDKLAITLSKDANKERLLNLIQSDNVVQISLQEGAKDIFRGNPGDVVVLESKNKTTMSPVNRHKRWENHYKPPKNKPDISSTTIERYKNSPDVASALTMLEYNGFLIGISYLFTVKLKSETSFEELQNLVAEKGCVILEENQFVKKQFPISVPKTSNLNSLQLANIFYETGLFEFSEPNFVNFIR